MKKALKQISISKNEYELLAKLKNANLSIFSIKDARIILKKMKIYNTISGAIKKGLIRSPKKGVYFLAEPNSPELTEVACNIYWPAYISFWTALSLYKFTEQMPTVIFVATTKISKEIIIDNTMLKFIKLLPKTFFGYEKRGNIIIASKEKAIIDSLFLPRYAGGILEVTKCINAGWGEIDKNKLIDYALKINNLSLIKRLGYIIEESNLKIEGNLLKKLEQKLGEGFSKLDPQGSENGKLNKKWSLIINIKDLFGWKKVI